MKFKILSTLKTKYSNLGFSEKTFEGVAEYLAATVTEESQIETAISGVENLLKSFQGDNDRLRSERSELQKKIAELEKNQNPNPNPKEEKKDSVLTADEIAKIVADSVKPFTEKLAQLEQQSAAEKRNAEISAKAKEYNIPEILIPKFKIDENADIDEFMKGIKQTFANIGFENVKNPELGGGDTKDESQQIAGLINKGTKEIIESKK